MGVTEPVDLYTKALAFFGEQLQRVDDEQWDLPTPCTDWDVRQVAAHVVVGEVQLADMVAGRPVAEVAEVDSSILGSSPMAAWRGTALTAIESVVGIDDLDRPVAHPLGEFPLRSVLDFRITENLVHGWDLGVAVDQAPELPDELAEHCLAFWQPAALDLARSEFFGPMVEPPPNPTSGQRLLALLGRA